MRNLSRMLLPRHPISAACPRLHRRGDVTPDAVFGVLSLIIWALVVIVTVKYVLIMLRADNHGEGGILTLMALVQRIVGHDTFVIPLLGVLGASLFYGDAVITPALSVLSAVEGLSLITPAFDPWVVLISIVILFGLFVIQSRGTASMAAWFGPVMALWFGILAVGGLAHVMQRPVQRPAPDGDPGDRRDDHRQPSGHHRSLAPGCERRLARSMWVEGA